MLFADGGPSVGLGHVVRSCALAEALVARGVKVLSVATPPDEGARAVCVSFSLAWSDWDHAPRADLVCVDSYRSTPALAVPPHGAPRLRVDIADGRGRRTEADVVVDGAPGAEAREYEGPRLRAVLAGPAYALVPRCLTRVRAASRVDRAVISLGSGADRTLVEAAAEAVADVVGWPVDVVVGPYTPAPRLGDGIAHRGLLPADVAVLLGTRRLAVVGGGQTLLHAIAAGAACVAVIVADNQRDQVGALSQAGALLAVVEPEGHSIWEALRTRCDPVALARASSVALGIIDGMGPDRVADALVEWARA